MLILPGIIISTGDSLAQDSDIPDQVWSLKFEGNNQYSSMVLNNQISTEQPGFWEKLKFWDRTGHELNELEVKKDVVRLRNYYQRRGYAKINVNYRIETGNKAWKKKVTFILDENAPIRISSIDYKLKTDQNGEEIRESPSFRNAQRRHAFQIRNRYETIREPEVIGRFTDVLKNLGYAYANVNIAAKIDSSKLTADVTINCVTGPKSYIDSIEVEGATTISKNYVLREASLHPGERYSLDKLQDAQQELFNHHLFRFATISIPDQPQDSTLNLLMRVRENKQRSVEVLGGFGTEEKLRGQVSWTHRNVFHKGHRFTATTHASFIEQTMTLDYLFPYMYNTKSSFVISPFGQHLLQKNFELLRGGVTNSFIYRYSRNLTGSASYEFTKNQELSQQFNADLPDTTRDYDLSSFQITGYYNQGFGREQEGWVVQPYAEVSGLFGFATFEFQKLSIDVRRFTQLGSSTVLATRAQAGSLFNVATDSLPNNIRFYLGGTNSVRGWYRQELGPKRARIDDGDFIRYVPLGGRAKLGFNLEIRQNLNFFLDGLGIAIFLDGGQIWETVGSFGIRKIQFGTGGGVRYQSPIGPIRVDIGYKVNPTDEDLNIYNGQNFGSAWDRFGIHFSIGQAF